MASSRLRDIRQTVLGVESEFAGRNTGSSASLLHDAAETVLASVAVLIADDDGRLLDANAAASLLTGYTRDELRSMSLWELTPAPEQQVGHDRWKAFLRERRSEGVYHLRRKDGQIVRTEFVAVANVLPGIHVAALTASPSLTLVRD
jgi:PAS domain S-box-containing protein